LLVAIGMAISMLTSARDDDRQRQDLTRQEAGMSALVQSRHQVSTIVVSGPDADETFRVTIHMNGSRQGPYTLYLAIRDQGRRKTLLENTQVINLTGGEQTAVFQVLLKKLKNNYKKLVLNHRGGALVEEDFMVQVTLQPLLSEKEKQALPRNELQNLGLGESRLIQTGSTHFPVRFIVR